MTESPASGSPRRRRRLGKSLAFGLLSGLFDSGGRRALADRSGDFAFSSRWTRTRAWAGARSSTTCTSASRRDAFSRTDVMPLDAQGEVRDELQATTRSHSRPDRRALREHLHLASLERRRAATTTMRRTRPTATRPAGRDARTAPRPAAPGVRAPRPPGGRGRRRATHPVVPPARPSTRRAARLVELVTGLFRVEVRIRSALQRVRRRASARRPTASTTRHRQMTGRRVPQPTGPRVENRVAGGREADVSGPAAKRLSRDSTSAGAVDSRQYAANALRSRPMAAAASMPVPRRPRPHPIRPSSSAEGVVPVAADLHALRARVVARRDARRRVADDLLGQQRVLQAARDRSLALVQLRAFDRLRARSAPSSPAAARPRA